MKARKTINILLVTGLACGLTSVFFTSSPAIGRPIAGAFLNSTTPQASSTPAPTVKVAANGWLATWHHFKHEAQQTANTWEANLQKKWHSMRTAYQTKPSNSRMPASTNGATANTTVSQEPVLTKTQKQFSKLLKQAQKVSSKKAIQVVAPARAGTSVLPKTKSGVPVFALQHVIHKKHRRIVIRVKNIPRLDIGTEKSISAAQLIPSNLVVGLSKKQVIHALPSPPMPSWVATRKVIHRRLAHVATAKLPMRGGLKLGTMVTEKRINAVDLTMVPTQPLSELKTLKEFTPDELAMLAAAIYFQKGNKCHITSGLLTYLVNKAEFSEEANYDLGVCAYQMGFHTEAVSRLIRVVRAENPDYAPTAIADLVDHLPRIYDSEVGPVLRNIKNRSLIPAQAEDNYHFVLARYAHEQGEYQVAAEQAAKVSEKSPLYADAQYFRAIGLYGAKHINKAEKALIALRKWMSNHGDHSDNLKGLIAMNLGRMYFIQGRYQLAKNEFMKVPKNNPLWIEALIEQGWSQLNVGDDNGAIGNMYSLHSPFFKLVYDPESWVVRTIGYIDICQYGDAYHALQIMEHKYRSFQKDVEAYLSNRKGPTSYYDTIKTYVNGPSERNVDGLPYPVIRDIASRRAFLNDQNAINNLVDEVGQYSYVYGILRKDQSGLLFRTNRTKFRLIKLKREIATINSHPQDMQYLNEWIAQKHIEQRLYDQQRFEGQLYERARIGYLRMKAMAVAQIDSKKSELVDKAGYHLMAQLHKINHQLAQIFSGNEFLRYEIFAGSGQNIRYQVSGGATEAAQRIPADVKPQKVLNWNFDGEYWEDEIGSYRSNLRNNCPKNPRTDAALTGAAGASKTE